MELLDIIKNRRSVRRFQDKKIPENIVDKLVDALIWAPSAGNLQSRKFYFVFGQKTKNELAQAALNQDFIARAPLVVVGCANNEIQQRYGERGKEIYSICDVSASVQNMLLLAFKEGLGSCWVGAFDDKKVSEILGLPKNLQPIVMAPIGFPAETPLIPSRVSKQETINIIE